ncbi:MAG: hypothetical protein HY039_06060 [Nitrospirae bacterium]|nr:hypothetical protein [Nitrospirota bacterium]
MEETYAVAIGALISGGLIVLNERLKIRSERKKQKDKFAIWKALEQTGPTPASLKIEDLCGTGLPKEKVEPLIFEMIRDGLVAEGNLPGTYTRVSDRTANPLLDAP